MPRGGARAGAGRKPNTKPSPQRHPGGRPSLYRPEYCEEIVAFCRDGHSITGFAGHIGVSRDTISEWGKQNKEFSAAIRAAKAAATLAYEKDAKRVREKGGGPGTATIIIFGLKNMAPDDYRDKQDIEHSGSVQYVERDKLDLAT